MLAPRQGEIVTLHFQELLGGAALDDDPFPDDGDDVSVLDGGETVSDDDGRSVGHGIVERCLDNLKE